MAIDILTLKKSKKYVDDTLKGEGALKGKDGYTPTIKENENNTDDVYKLDITNENDTFTTPNLKGASGVDVSEEVGNIITLKEDGLYAKGGEETFLVTFYFSSTSMSLMQNANKTYAEISTALDEGKVVILKGIDTSQNSQQFYYFNVSKYDKSASQIIFTRVYHTYGAKPEIWYYLLGLGHKIGKFTIDLSNYVTEEKLAEEIAGASHLTREIVTEIPTVDTAKDNVIYMYKVESATGSDVYQEYQLINGAVVLVGDTSVDLTDYQKLLSGTKGQFVSFDDTGKALAVDVGLSYADFSSISGVTDINNLKTNGIYNFSSAITNSPPNMDRYTLEVFTWYRYVVQRAFGFKASTTSSATNSRPTYYIRMYDTMLYSWTSWSLISGSTAVDGALVSTSINPVQNKVIYNALSKKQDKLTGTEYQFATFDADGNLEMIDGFPAFGAVYNGANNDERIEISSSSLVIKQHFKRAKLTLSNSLPSSYSVRGGPVAIDIYRLADGTYKSTSTCSPIIAPSSANKLSLYNWSVSANVTEQEDGTLKITTSAGGGISIIDVSTGATTGSGSGGAGGDFNQILVWF